MKEVTVTITSCGRQDLLEKTIDSFLLHNTYPIKEYVIVEDSGIKGINDYLKEKYSHLNIRWIENETNIGQNKSLDKLYSGITSEYVFHCEDDWEFIQSRFIEKSMSIMDNNSEIIQVHLRAHNDMNGHPIEYFNQDYDLLSLWHNGCWCGFSFNPGLRRYIDYKSIESYSKIRLHKDIYEKHGEIGVEGGLSVFYGRLGFRAAILKTAHVIHIGGNRHLPYSY